jgi:hypothetical protein
MADITKQDENAVVVQLVKPWWQSKVIWFNLFVVGASLITTATPALEQYMSPESYGLLTSIVGVINALLRLSTSQAIVKKAVDDE